MPIISHPKLGRIAFPESTPLDAIRAAVEGHLARNNSSAPMGIVQGEVAGMPTAMAERMGVAPRGQTAWEAAPPQFEDPASKGMIGSAIQALGFPTTMPEAQAMQDENNPFKHPSNLLGPLTPMIRGYGQNVGNRLKNMVQESYDAGQNIGNGQPVAQNVGKAGLSGLQAVFSMIPGVGENANTLGMQEALGNNSGATGTMLGTLLPFAAGAVGEKLPRTPISPKTLPMPEGPMAPPPLRPFEKPFLQQADVPQALKDHIVNGGAEYKGAMQGTNLLFFNDPETHSTLAMPSYLIDSPEAVAKHMRMSRGEFAIAAARKAAAAGAGGSAPNPNGAGGMSASQPVTIYRGGKVGDPEARFFTENKKYAENYVGNGRVLHTQQIQPVKYLDLTNPTHAQVVADAFKKVGYDAIDPSTIDASRLGEGIGLAHVPPAVENLLTSKGYDWIRTNNDVDAGMPTGRVWIKLKPSK